MKTRIAAAALVALLALTGCAGAPDAESEQRSTATESETSAPLVAETPEAEAEDDAEVAFLAYVRENLPTPTSIPDATDEQLLAAGEDACARLTTGEPADGMVVVEGEQPWENGTYYDSATIVTGASINLCPA